MHKPTLLLVLAVAAACAGDADPDTAVIAGFLDRSTAVECHPVELPGHPAVTELRLATDSTFLVLDAPGRQVVELDHDLRPVWRSEYPAAGPGSAESAVSAALLGDTAVAIAGRAGLRLVVIDRAGELIRSVPLGFIPHSLEATDDGDLLVTPMPVGDKPTTLLQRFDGETFHPLPVPPRPYADMMIRALGNAALVETLPDGAALLVHQYMAPRAFRIEPTGEVAALPLPVPDATAGSAAFVPVSPITEDQISRMLVPAIAMSVDVRHSRVYVLTRSGRTVDGRPQRAILRLDDHLRFIDAFTFDVPAGAMVYLPRRRTALVADEEDGIHACSIPDGAASRDHAE